jgi:hypothetical protein
MNSDKAKWAPGEMADGSISIMTPEEASRSIADRDAEEEAFESVLGGDSDDDLRADYEAAAEGEDLEEE